MPSLEEQIKQAAREAGFTMSGITTAAPADDFAHFQEWLERGYAGEMHYLSEHQEARRAPTGIMPDVRSVLMLGMEYGSAPIKTTAGRISSYALGKDYHDSMRAAMNLLLRELEALIPGCRGRVVVDTAPLLERDFARRAGLGWIGKNTMLIHKQRGSFFFIGAILLDVVLGSDPPFLKNHCGTCTACLDACPTSAFVEPYVLDARRCISYLTIELRGPVPSELREGVGDWIFGCDICQDVCPWNRHSPEREAEEIMPSECDSSDLLSLVQLDESTFRKKFRGTALWRAKRKGIVRNAAIVLGNVGDNSALPILSQIATNDPDPVISEAAAWACMRIRSRNPL